MQTADDTSDHSWDNVPHLFFENKSNFEYNMSNLVALSTPVARLKVVHNCAEAAKQ